MEGSGHMAFDDRGGPVAAVGMDHVRLGYAYLDRGDLDGYASLLDPGAVLDEPGFEPVRGRRAVVGFRTSRGGAEHELHDVFAADGRVAAVGRVRDEGAGDVDFADIYTLSEHGLLVSQRRFYFVNPRRSTALST
jgi:hypothetical protein